MRGEPLTTERNAAVRMVAASMVIALATVSCSSGGDSTTSTTATPPPSEPLSSSITLGTQLAADFLNYFDASEFGDIELDRTYGGDRERLPAEAEAPYPEQIRGDPSVAGAGISLDRFSDDALLYLGYTFCLFRDVEAPPDVAIQAVVAMAARTSEREPTEPALEDLVTGVTVASYASGSLCPEYFEDTRTFIDLLSG